MRTIINKKLSDIWIEGRSITRRANEGPGLKSRVGSESFDRIFVHKNTQELSEMVGNDTSLARKARSAVSPAPDCCPNELRG